MHWYLIGSAAAALTTFSLVPQIVKTMKTKSAKDISILMLIQFSLGVLLWIAYGVHLRNPILVIANSVSLCCLSFLLFLYFSYGRSKT